jgi:hypothetical protein
MSKDFLHPPSHAIETWKEKVASTHKDGDDNGHELLLEQTDLLNIKVKTK